MCDALSRNPAKEFQTILANCLSHGRRQFVDIAQNFPAECRHVLESLAEVYKHDAQAKDAGLSPEARLRFHQEHSQPVCPPPPPGSGTPLEAGRSGSSRTSKAMVVTPGLRRQHGQAAPLAAE